MSIFVRPVSTAGWFPIYHETSIISPRKTSLKWWLITSERCNYRSVKSDSEYPGCLNGSTQRFCTTMWRLIYLQNTRTDAAVMLKYSEWAVYFLQPCNMMKFWNESFIKSTVTSVAVLFARIVLDCNILKICFCPLAFSLMTLKKTLRDLPFFSSLQMQWLVV